MKKLIVAIILSVSLHGCDIGIPNYKVTQEIERNYLFEDLVLTTTVWHKGDILEIWADKVEIANDSIKQCRLKVANELVDKCKRLEE